MNSSDRWLLGIAFLMFLVFVWSTGRQLDRIIALMERDEERLPKAFWGIRELLNDIKWRLPDPGDDPEKPE